MTKTANIPDLERITFFGGQQLTAADLTALQHAHRELRWLHNRSLHQWGIGIGLGVTGERGDTAVTVQPGFGIDCLGREIILTAPQDISVPAVAAGPGGREANYYLVAAYQTDDKQEVAERRPGVCLPAGTVRLSELPRLEWRQPEQLREGFELILAEAWIRNCQLSRSLSLTVRRSARPGDQPYTAAGQTGIGQTVWETWTIDNGRVVGVFTKVNTSAARFRFTPRYQAHVVGERLWTDGTDSVLVAGFPGVAEATPQGFTMQVFLPQMEASNINAEAIGDDLKWHVAWLGIEI